MLALQHNPIFLRAMHDPTDQAPAETMTAACREPKSMLRQKGMTLIELMVGIVVIGILFALGAPNFRNWIQSSQIRTFSESILNGLQLAKSAAVNRNAPVSFVLTSTLDATCAASPTGTNWIVLLSPNDPTNQCNAAPSDTAAPFIIQKGSGTEGSPNAAVSAVAATITFDGLGRASTGANTITVSNPTGGACAGGGPMRCLHVEVTPGGRIRMCDPALATTDPQGCY